MKELENILHKLLPRDRTLHLSHGIVQARRDWGVVLIVSALLVIALIGFSIYLFVSADTDTFVVTSGQEVRGIGTIDRSILRETLDAFEAQTVLLEELRTAAPSIGNP